LKVWHEAPFQVYDVKLATFFAHFVSFVISATKYINMLLAVLMGDSKKSTLETTAWKYFNLMVFHVNLKDSVVGIDVKQSVVRNHDHLVEFAAF